MIKMAADTPQTDIAYHARRRHEMLKSRIHNTESESDARQCVISFYDLDLVGHVEKDRIDYYNEELLLEFKHHTCDLRKLDVRCKVFAQLLHYVYQMPTKHGKFDLPENMALATARCIILYRTEDFFKYLIIDEYFSEASSPSKDHPKLEKALRKDPNIRGMMFHTIADYDKLWSEFEKRGVYG